MGATEVAGGDVAAQAVGDGAGDAADVEGLACAVHDDRDDAGVAGQHAQRCGVQGAAEVEHRGAGPGFQVFESDDHIEVRAAPAALGEHVARAVVEDVSADLGEGLGLPFGR